MLQRLLIKNYALIEHLEIDFHQGLNIITGETGAGKSILLGALGMILGARADVTTLMKKDSACVVEGVFDLSGHSLDTFFNENDLDYSQKTIIRRVISPAGKSRAFVNELPVNLSQIKELVNQIIDIHSQHQNLLLVDTSFQLKVLDSYTNNGQRLNEYMQLYFRYKTINNELNKLREKTGQAKADLDYYQFQLTQLDEAKLKVGEEQELETLQQQLAHAEDIKSSLQDVSAYLNSDDMSALIWLKDSEALLDKIVEYFPAAKDLSERIESCRIELKDVAQEVDNLNQKVELDPEQLEAVNQRLDLLQSLQHKHRVASSQELIDLRERLRLKVDEISNYDFELESKQKELDEVVSKAKKIAQGLSKVRSEGRAKFEQSVKSILVQLGIPHADFKVKINQTKGFNPNGLDEVTFQFTANKNMPLQELQKVASGGEISRLMLSLKSLMVKTKALPTIILDEIDSGVSGEVADKVGIIISNMAQGMQVINITHLPQIASKGKHHFLVYKAIEQDTSKTKIKLLNNDERVVEIAKMLSGKKLSEAALTNAKYLLEGSLDK